MRAVTVSNSIEDAREAWEEHTQGVKGIIIYAVLGVIAAMMLNSVVGALLGTSFPVVTVSSTSMVPALSVGDLVIVDGQETYEPGDIIVFHGWETRPIIHRVVAKADGETVQRAEYWRKSGELQEGHWNEMPDNQILRKDTNSDTVYITHGDANPTCDQCSPNRPIVEESDIHGRALIAIPYLGHVKLFAMGTASGFLT